MKKIVFFLLLSIWSIAPMQAQDNTGQKKVRQVFINVGPGYSSFQDQFFSLNLSKGIAGGFQLGYSKQGANFSRFYIGGNGALLGQKADVASILVGATFNYAWMKGLKFRLKEEDRFYLGGDIDASLLFKRTPDLGNSSTTFLYSNTLSIATKYDRPLSNRWTLGGEFSLGLLSWVKLSNGYAYANPQDFTAEGKFNYTDNVVLPPYKYGKMAGIGSFNRMKSKISLLKHGRRISWGAIYDWELKAQDPYEFGQIVDASHLVKFYFGFTFGRHKLVK